MSKPMNERDKARLNVRLVYTRELASVQAEQLEKSMLEIIDISSKLGLDAKVIESLNEVMSLISILKKLRG